jgi:mannose-1-phosphate guanylyltransferase/mannose-6-phosphate isomerase
MIIPLILAGGSGIRLWPLSRKSYPKQLLSLIERNTLLQSTLHRVKSLRNIAPPVVIGNDEHRFILAEQIRQVDPDATILLEAESRNTGPAVTVATLYAMTKVEDPFLLVLPTDLYISDPKIFADMIDKAVAVAELGKLVTWGVMPSSAETGYGYIKKGPKLLKTSGFTVERFVEKPKLNVAKSYVRSGNYFWNSGIFLFRASVLLKELQKYFPDILSLSQKALKELHISRDFVYLAAETMKTCPSIPIDKAIFENTKEAVVFPFPCEWMDLGDWNSLYKIGQKDKNSNVVNKNVITFNTKNCYLYSSQQLLVTSGMEDCLVVATMDAILVAHLNKKQDMKVIVDFLVNQKRHEALSYPEGFHSWGHFRITEKSPNSQVKHYFIKPEHFIISNHKPHWSTYWILADGQGKLTIEKKTELMSKNESLCISNEKKYQLKNIAATSLHLIEIQVRVKKLKSSWRD